MDHPEAQAVPSPARRPQSGFAGWRTRSRACALVDVVVAVAGAALFLAAAVDSVASWPADRVLLAEHGLARFAGVVLTAGWPWLFLSFLPLSFGAARVRDAVGSGRAGRGRSAWRRLWPNRPVRLTLALAAIVCVAVIAGGYAVGAGKGDARVLPGPQYEVSTLDLNRAQWTPVSRRQYTVWQARFVRGDSLFTVFGLAMAAVSLAMLGLHREATGESEGSESWRHRGDGPAPR
jgi:hypothetical protein